MVTDLYLIRHGESVPNVEPIIGGMRGDAGLTARGREQAELLAARLVESRFRADVLYASTLPRALETARYVARALDLPVVPDDDLHELRPGEADGLSVAEWQRLHSGPDARDFEADPFRPFAPGGESWATFLLRTGARLSRLVMRHPGERVVAICHGGVLEASFYLAFGLGPTGNRVYFAPLNASITHWRYRPAGDGKAATWTLISFNDAAHLQTHRVGDVSREAVPTPVEDDAG